MRIRPVKHLAILGLGWLLFVGYAYPGLMTMDSIDQLEQARTGFFTDAHPPAMSALWRLVDVICAGPFGMLVIQSTVFLAGLYAVLRRALRPMAAAIAAAALLLFPPILTPMAVIWKDSLMAGLLMLGIAGLLSERRDLRIAGLAAFVAATAVRYNAPAATFSLVVILFPWTPWKPVLARYGVAVGAWIAITLCALGLGAALTDREMHIWHSSLAPMDIAGTLDHVDGTLPDDQLRELLRGTELLVDKDIHAALRNAYTPRDFVYTVAGGREVWHMPLWGTTPAPAAKRDAFSRAYWDTVTAYPGAYLASRAATMRYVLALTEAPAESTVMIHRLQLVERLRELGIDPAPSRIQAKWQRAVSKIAVHTPLFRPWMYLVLALVMLGFCRGHRDIFAILLSGIGCESSLFVLAASPDYRYSHWLVVCTCVGIVLLVARRIVLHRRPGDDGFGA